MCKKIETKEQQEEVVKLLDEIIDNNNKIKWNVEIVKSEFFNENSKNIKKLNNVIIVNGDFCQLGELINYLIEYKKVNGKNPLTKEDYIDYRYLYIYSV